jgi:hypothetical protein
MYTIPKELVKEWDMIKTDSLKRIDAIKNQMVTEADKKLLRKQFAELLDNFDRGLKDKMKTAASAKSEAEAAKAAAKVVEVADDYTKKIDAAAKKYGQLGDGPRKDIQKVLAKIRMHAQASTKARPPLTLAAGVVTAWKAACTRADKAVATLGLPPADVRELENKVQAPVDRKVELVTRARGDEALVAALRDLAKTITAAAASLDAWVKVDKKRDTAGRDLRTALKNLLDEAKATAAKAKLA